MLLEEREEALPRAGKHHALFILIIKELKDNKRKMGQLVTLLNSPKHHEGLEFSM